MFAQKLFSFVLLSLLLIGVQSRPTRRGGLFSKDREDDATRLALREKSTEKVVVDRKLEGEVSNDKESFRLTTPGVDLFAYTYCPLSAENQIGVKVLDIEMEQSVDNLRWVPKGFIVQPTRTVQTDVDIVESSSASELSKSKSHTISASAGVTCAMFGAEMETEYKKSYDDQTKDKTRFNSYTAFVQQVDTEVTNGIDDVDLSEYFVTALTEMEGLDEAKRTKRMSELLSRNSHFMISGKLGSQFSRTRTINEKSHEDIKKKDSSFDIKGSIKVEFLSLGGGYSTSDTDGQDTKHLENETQLRQIITGDNPREDMKSFPPEGTLKPGILEASYSNLCVLMDDFPNSQKTCNEVFRSTFFCHLHLPVIQSFQNAIDEQHIKESFIQARSYGQCHKAGFPLIGLRAVQHDADLWTNVDEDAYASSAKLTSAHNSVSMEQCAIECGVGKEQPTAWSFESGSCSCFGAGKMTYERCDDIEGNCLSTVTSIEGKHVWILPRRTMVAGQMLKTVSSSSRLNYSIQNMDILQAEARIYWSFLINETLTEIDDPRTWNGFGVESVYNPQGNVPPQYRTPAGSKVNKAQALHRLENLFTRAANLHELFDSCKAECKKEDGCDMYVLRIKTGLEKFNDPDAKMTDDMKRQANEQMLKHPRLLDCPTETRTGDITEPICPDVRLFSWLSAPTERWWLKDRTLEDYTCDLYNSKNIWYLIALEDRFASRYDWVRNVGYSYMVKTK